MIYDDSKKCSTEEYRHRMIPYQRPQDYKQLFNNHLLVRSITSGAELRSITTTKNKHPAWIKHITHNESANNQEEHVC